MMDYLKLLEHSYSLVEQMQEAPPRSRLEYLSQHIFDFTTYETEADQLFARRAVEVCAAVSDGKTFEYIADDQGRIWYLLMVNMPFFIGRLEWGTSIRGAWWAMPTPFDSCGLFVGDSQQTDWTFSAQEWDAFVRAIIAFAQPEMEQGERSPPVGLLGE